MPKLLGLQRTYNEFVDEENRARSRTLQGLRNKLKLNIEEIKPTELKDITEEADFMNYADLLSRSASVLAQQATRTALKVQEEAGSRVSRTNPFRDNEEFTKLISYFNRLQAIIQKQFKAGKVSENDIENIRRLFLQNGTIGNLENIRTSFNQMALEIPAITEQAEIIDRVYKSVDSGLYIKVQFPTSFKLITEPRAVAEEAGDFPAPEVGAPPSESRESFVSFPETALTPTGTIETEGLRGIEGEEIPEEPPVRIPSIFQPASIGALKPSLPQRLRNIPSMAEREAVISDLEAFRDSAEFREMNRGQRTQRVDEMTSAFKVGSGRGFGVGLGRGFGVGLGACGSGRFGYPSNSRFTPLTLYNDEGQNIYALRKFES